MSAGRFNKTAKYETADGAVRPIKIQPETITTWNPEPAGTSSGAFVKVGGSRRGYGATARLARFEWNGAPPAGYDARGTITLPILTPAAWNGLTFGTTYAYQGATLNLLGRTGERIR
jgi:hypothetical protein